LKFLVKELEKLKIFTSENVEKLYKDYVEKNGIKGADVIHPTRLALSGRTEGPSLFLMMEILGKEETVKRLTKVL